MKNENIVKFEEGKFIFNDVVNNSYEEAYKVLRTNIQFCDRYEDISTITITSCNSSEGKTETAVNLGLSLAKLGIKVLLVDADLRKPLNYKPWRNEYLEGLSGLLSCDTAYEGLIFETNIADFYFTPCGMNNANPAELIGSKGFAGFLQYAANCFEIVIIDTPPLNSVIDAAVIAAQTDGTILVVEANSTKIKSIRRARQQLEKVNASMLGIVLNKVRKNEFRDYYNYRRFSGKPAISENKAANE